MTYSIAEALYEWMHKRRIVAEIAAEMGIDGSTLAAKLRPNAMYARLAADDLLPLCQAARKAGYGRELDRVLQRFVRDLAGTETAKVDRATMMSHVLELGKGMSVLLACAERISKIDDPEEIRRLKMLVSTEMLPVVLQMEDLLDRRLKKLARSNRSVTAEVAVTAEQPDKS